MHTPFSPLDHLSPGQRQALYDQARREALALRRQAIADATDAIGRALRAAARRVRAALPGAAHVAMPPRAVSCPR